MDIVIVLFASLFGLGLAVLLAHACVRCPRGSRMRRVGQTLFAQNRTFGSGGPGVEE